MTQRRQVGFIKTYTASPSLPQEPSQFSYFRLRPKQDDDEFSPYKFEEDLKETVQAPPRPKPRPPLPQRVMEKAQTMSNLGDRAKADELYLKIRQNIANYQQKRSLGKQNLQENIGSIRNKIEQLDEVLKDLKTKPQVHLQKRAASHSQKRKFQSDSSSSSSSQEYEVKAIPSPQMNSPKEKRLKRRNFEEESQRQEIEEEERGHSKEKIVTIQQPASDGEQEEYDSNAATSNMNQVSQPEDSLNRPEPNVITFNSRLKNQPPLKIEKYSSSSSESEEEDSRPITEQHLKRSPIANKPAQVFKNKGGVCFDIDVKQFTVPVVIKEDKVPVVPPSKAKKVDKRVELLKRRQAAKAYDRKARRAVFSPQY